MRTLSDQYAIAMYYTFDWFDLSNCYQIHANKIVNFCANWNRFACACVCLVLYEPDVNTVHRINSIVIHVASYTEKFEFNSFDGFFFHRFCNFRFSLNCTDFQSGFVHRVQNNNKKRRNQNARDPFINHSWVCLKRRIQNNNNDNIKTKETQLHLTSKWNRLASTESHRTVFFLLNTKTNR